MDISMKNKKMKWSDGYLFVITLLLYIPIILTVLYSFNASKISSVWGGISFAWYQELYHDKGMLEAVKNSLILAAMSIVLSNLISVSAAIGMKNSTNGQHRVISFMAMLPIMIPEIILGMSFLAVFSFASLPFGMITLVIAHTSFCIPYIFLMVKARLEDMDPSIEEAAKDLGANSFQIFKDITIPAILPGIIAGSLLAFAMSFDDVVISIFVTGATTNTMAVKIYTKLKTGITPEINALATVMLVIILMILCIYYGIVKLWNKDCKRERE